MYKNTFQKFAEANMSQFKSVSSKVSIKFPLCVTSLSLQLSAEPWKYKEEILLMLISKILIEFYLLYVLLFLISFFCFSLNKILNSWKPSITLTQSEIYKPRCQVKCHFLHISLLLNLTYMVFLETLVSPLEFKIKAQPAE